MACGIAAFLLVLVVACFILVVAGDVESIEVVGTVDAGGLAVVLATDCSNAVVLGCSNVAVVRDGATVAVVSIVDAAAFVVVLSSVVLVG